MINKLRPRRFLRLLTVLPALLSITLWIASYFLIPDFRYSSPTHRGFEIGVTWGTWLFSLDDFSRSPNPPPTGWHLSAAPIDPFGPVFGFTWHNAGFDYSNSRFGTLVIIPCWFPTLLAIIPPALFFLRRPKSPPGFPIEPT